MGPLKVKMPLELTVVSHEAGHSLHVVATGKDPALGSGVKVDIKAVLTGQDTSSYLALDVMANVSGKIAGLGFGLFKRKFDDIMTQFGKQVKAAIEEVHQPVS